MVKKTKPKDGDIVCTEKLYGCMEKFVRIKDGKPVPGEIIVKWTAAINQPTK